MGQVGQETGLFGKGRGGGGSVISVTQRAGFQSHYKTLFSISFANLISSPYYILVGETYLLHMELQRENPPTVWKAGLQTCPGRWCRLLLIHNNIYLKHQDLGNTSMRRGPFVRTLCSVMKPANSCHRGFPNNQPFWTPRASSSQDEY